MQHVWRGAYAPCLHATGRYQPLSSQVGNGSPESNRSALLSMAAARGHPMGTEFAAVPSWQISPRTGLDSHGQDCAMADSSSDFDSAGSVRQVDVTPLRLLPRTPVVQRAESSLAPRG